MKLVVVVNMSAGALPNGGGRAVERIERAFRAAGLAPEIVLADRGNLLETVRSSLALGPEVVSDDLTQRALRSQFVAARAYLDRIPFPLIVVPGNHDIPLHDLAGRFLRPLARYRRYISNDLTPLFCEEGLAVLGINTTWPLCSVRCQSPQVVPLPCLPPGDTGDFPVKMRYIPYRQKTTIPPLLHASIESERQVSKSRRSDCVVSQVD